MTKNTKKWLTIGSVVAVGTLAGGYAYAKGKAKPAKAKPPSAQQAVTRAIQMLPNEDVTDLTDMAYVLAYPNCPPKLDPDDAAHADCIRLWLDLREIVYAKLPEPEKRQPKQNQGLSDTGPAADLRGWMESLSPSQQSKLRDIIGNQYYGPMKNASESGDDAATVRAVTRFKSAAEDFASEHPLDAMKQYNDLKSLLGPKLDELMRLAKKYQ